MITNVIITKDVYQSDVKKDDVGFIDGYVRGGDNTPLAVFIRHFDGAIDLVPLHAIRCVMGTICGQDLINSLAKMLQSEGVLTMDSAIINKLRSLTSEDLQVIIWKNDEKKTVCGDA